MLPVNRTTVRELFLILFGISLAVSISAALIVSYILFLEWLFRRFERPAGSLLWDASAKIVAAFIVWGIIATIIANPAKLTKSITSQSGFFLFFLAAHAWTPRDLKILAVWFCAACAVVGGCGALQALGGINYFQHTHQTVVPEFFREWPEWIIKALSMRDSRALGTRSHPLTFAESLMPGFFLAVYFACRRADARRFRSAALWVGALALISAGLLFAQGRAVWVAVACGFVVYILFDRRNKYLLTVFAILLVVMSSVIASSPRLRGRMMSVFSATSGSTSDRESRASRLELWRAARDLVARRPITGAGIKNVRLEVPDPHFKTPRKWSETHNVFIQVAAERGLPGLLLFLGFAGIIAWKIFRLDPRLTSLFFAMGTAFIVAGLTESWISDKEIAMLFWVFTGAVLNFHRARRETA